MRILITGSSGFIGTNLIDAARKKGHTVLGIDRKPPVNTAHQPVFEQIDLTKAADVTNVVGRFRPTHVWHMGARTDLVDGEANDLYAANTIGTRNLIDAMKTINSVERCIHASTKLVCAGGKSPPDCGEYCPDTTYGESKVLMEQIIHGAENTYWQWCIVRPTSIWGPWFDIPYRSFFLTIARKRYMHLGDANPPRSFGYVGNIVYQIEKLNEADASLIQGKVFYVTDYDQYRIREWADKINAALGYGPIRQMPESLVQAAARIGDLLKRCGWENPPLTSFRLNNMRTDTSHVPIDELRNITGPLPYSLDQGTDNTIAWLKDQRMI